MMKDITPEQRAESIAEVMRDDPQPRRGYRPGDVVVINVDAYGLLGREPHPPVTRVAPGRTESPCVLGVVAYYDAEHTPFEWEGAEEDRDRYGYLPTNYYYVATNAGYYVFADYELRLAQLGNLDNLKEPWRCAADNR